MIGWLLKAYFRIMRQSRIERKLLRYPKGLRNKIRNANIICLLILSVCLPQAVLFWFINTTIFFLTVAVCAATTLLILLSAAGYQKLFRLALLTFLNVSIYLLSEMLGANSYQFMFFLFAMIIPFLIAVETEFSVIALGVLQPPILGLAVIHGWGHMPLRGTLAAYSLQTRDLAFMSTSLLLAGTVGLLYYYHEKKERALRQTIGRLLQQNRKKREFIDAITHDTLTPIHGIMGSSELLKTSLQGKREKELLQRIEASAANLTETIRSLAWSMDQTGINFDTEEEIIDLKQLLKSICLPFYQSAERKGLKLKVNGPESLPPLYGSRRLIAVILSHLLDNAVKFTQRGSIELNLKPAGKRGRLILFTGFIEDTGEGIPEIKRSGLFKLFSRTTTSLNRRNSGTGVGLHLVRTLLGRMGGSIAYQPVLTGSRFEFDFCLRKAGGGADIRADFLKNMRVLIVDDNEINLNIAAAMLEHAGCRVSTAENCRTALKLCESEGFHLILMDLQMPEIDGIECARCIFEKIGQDKVPVVALTASDHSEMRTLTKRNGFAGFIAKPLTLESLKLELIRVFEQDPGIAYRSGRRLN